MKSLDYFFLILLFSFTCSIIAQDDPSGYTKSYFIEGLPDKLPDDLKNRLGKSFFFEIEGGDFLNSIFLVNKGENIHPDNFMFFYYLGKSKFYRWARISFSKNSNNSYMAVLKLKTELEDVISPLTVIYNKKEYILHKWGEDNSLPKIVKEYPYKVGNKLPNFKLENSSTKTDLNGFLDNVIVINWWATSCIPCIAEMPGLSILVEKYNNIEFISILDDKENLDAFLKKHLFKYTHYFGNEEIKRILGDTWPRNIVLDKSGIIVHNKLGGRKDTYKDIEKVILSCQN